MSIRNMSIGLAGLFLLLSGAVCAQAQPRVLPDRLLDFIKERDQVLIRAIRESGGVRVTILTEREARMLLDAKKLEFAELATRYPELQKLGEAAVERKLEAHKKREGFDPAKRKIVPVVELDYRHMNYPVSVLHVGSDYLLLESQQTPGKKYVHASSRVLTVDWFEGIVIDATIVNAE